MIDTQPNAKFHRLRSLSVVGGFLDGLTLDFAEGLNCLIGHRGTGKTTVLEFVRYALDEFPNGEDGQACRQRVEAIVKSNLGDGRIRLAIETKDGLQYIVDRTASGDPLVLTTDEQPTDVRINSAGLFSADIFSQNEIENIADSPQSQLELIDRFAAGEIAEVNRRAAAVRAKLEVNTNAIVTHSQQLDGLADEIGTLPFVEAKIKALAGDQGDQTGDGVNIAHEHRALRGRETQAVDEARTLIQKYNQWLGDSSGQFAQQARTAFDQSMFEGPNGQVMTRIRAQNGFGQLNPAGSARDPRAHADHPTFRGRGSCSRRADARHTARGRCQRRNADPAGTDAAPDSAPSRRRAADPGADADRTRGPSLA